MRLLIATLIATGLLVAQDAAKPAPSMENFEAVIIPVKTLTGDAFDRMVRLLSVFNARIQADSKLRTVVVYAPPSISSQIQKVIADLDRPGSPAAIGRNIDLTVSFIECLKAPPADARPVPAELEGVVRQLRTSTQCANPQLWESIPMRMQEGRDAQHSSNIQGPFQTLPDLARYLTLRMLVDSVGTREGARFARFGKVSIGLRFPVASGAGQNMQFQYQETGIDTSGDFFESQKTVIGKLSGGDSGATIFAVIALKVLD